MESSKIFRMTQKNVHPVFADWLASSHCDSAECWFFPMAKFRKDWLFIVWAIYIHALGKQWPRGKIGNSRSWGDSSLLWLSNIIMSNVKYGHVKSVGVKVLACIYRLLVKELCENPPDIEWEINSNKKDLSLRKSVNHYGAPKTHHND